MFRGSQASPACPSDKNSIEMKLSMEHGQNGIDKGKRMDPVKKKLSMPHCTLQISHILTRNRTRVSAPAVRAMARPLRTGVDRNYSRISVSNTSDYQTLRILTKFLTGVSFGNLSFHGKKD